MNALELRRRTLGKGVYKKTVEGNPAIAQGSLARMYPGITMQGWTEQAQYEGSQLFDGVFTIDTVLDANGETVPYSGRSTTDFIKVKQSTDYTGFTRYLRACYYDAGKVIISYDDDAVTRQTPEGCEYVRFCFINGSDVMFNEGSTALPYEPYTGGQPSPSPDYPQEIVSAGKYDEGTGKYQYTIKISNSEESPTKSQTVTITSDRPLTKWDRLEKRAGVWGWMYKSNILTIDESVTIQNGAGESGETVPYQLGSVKGISNSNNEIKCISNILRGIGNEAWNKSSVIGTYLMNGGNLTFRLKSDWASDINEAKQFLIDHNAYFVYETEEETFVPLSESEQEAMNELYTFRPTTVLSNDCDCNMSLTYKTKKSLEVTT